MRDIYSKENLLKVYNFIGLDYKSEDKVINNITVELVHNGFFKYKKLTYDNYYYWWCETEDIKKANKNIFTFNFKYLEITRKGFFYRNIFLSNKFRYASPNIMNIIMSIYDDDKILFIDTLLKYRKKPENLLDLI